jgi:parallel beta-helix repeat protein
MRWSILMILPLAFLLSCDGTTDDDDTCDGCEECTECAECPEDADGDGYTAEQGDCDDSDADIHPRAEEICGDGVDSDCSEDPDDGVTDADADGYVDMACTDGTDCDDADPERHPDLEDGCDGADNDCDEDVDEDTLVVDATGASAYTSIQEAVDAAGYGDVVCVYAGAYQEDVVLEGKNITLQSLDGAAATLIEGSGLGSTLSHTLGDGSTVIGFTIAGGAGTTFDPDHDGETDECGGGVFVDASTVILRELIITDNNATDGAGLYVNGANLTMEDTVITGNEATRYGGGVRIRASADVVISGCEISENIAGYGGGLGLYQGEPTLLDTILDANESTDKGGAIYAGTDSVVNLSSCTVTNNVAATKGGGIRLYNSRGVIGGCTISNNTAGEEGGGIHCKRSTMSLTMTDVIDNVPENTFCEDDCEGCTGA